MNINYLKISNKLKFMMSDIEKLLNNDKAKSFEDKEIYRLFEKILEEMKFGILKIEYYSKSPISGVLCELPNGHFEIQGHELTCGSPLEVFSKEYEEWFPGRVEYDDKYYFYCADLDNPGLYTGMEARLRF